MYVPSLALCNPSLLIAAAIRRENDIKYLVLHRYVLVPNTSCCKIIYFLFKMKKKKKKNAPI